jgi:hypothetical protein
LHEKHGGKPLEGGESSTWPHLKPAAFLKSIATAK